MLGFGKIKGGESSLEQAVKEKGLYPYLIDETGNWTERKDVRNVRVMGSGGPGQTRVFNNEWMTIKGNIGPEMGIGHHVGHALEAPVMILKSCIGNRGLGWDLLPPGSESWEYVDPKDGKTYVYAGYKQSPARWEKGTTPTPIGWYAGKQYDDDVANASGTTLGTAENLDALDALGAAVVRDVEIGLHLDHRSGSFSLACRNKSGSS